MSVINQMLRDLDKRRASPLEPALRPGTVPMPSAAAAVLPASGRARASLWALTTLSLAVAAVLGGWWWTQQEKAIATVDAPARAMPPLQSTETVAAEAVASVALMPKPETDPAPVPADMRPEKLLTLKSASSLQPPATVRVPETALVTPAKPMPSASASRAMPARGMSEVSSAPAAVSDTPPATAIASSPVKSPVVDSAVAVQRQQAATRDVLAQAQALYSAGSADAAIQMLQDSLATAEKASPPVPPATQLQLVRELARMELVQGRSAAVLDLLGRLEPLLAGQADLWAVRANAAQRLGRHQDAVQFYATALQTRPAEQRWLLGSAVSLAALGQLGAAAELADKARAIGPVSKEVLAYLRQQGVTLPERP